MNHLWSEAALPESGRLIVSRVTGAMLDAAQSWSGTSHPRGFAPRTPLHAPSRAASPARSGRVARSHGSLAPGNERQVCEMASSGWPSHRRSTDHKMFRAS